MIKRQTYFSSTHSVLIIYMLRKSMPHILFLLSDRLERVCSQYASKRLSIFHAGKFSLSLHGKPCYYVFNTGLLKTKMSVAYMFYISTCFFKKTVFPPLTVSGTSLFVATLIAPISTITFPPSTRITIFSTRVVGQSPVMMAVPTIVVV